MTDRLQVFLKAFLQLPKKELFHYLMHQVGKQTGIYRRQSLISLQNSIPDDLIVQPQFLTIPAIQKLYSDYREDKNWILSEADQICSGKVRLFGGPFVINQVEQKVNRRPWWAFNLEKDLTPGADIKMIWEPARFGWVFTLIQAFYLSGDSKYPEYFWRTSEKFMDENPPMMGPNWLSAQEVALRLFAFLAAWQAWGKPQFSSKNETKKWIVYLVQHARRIPITFRYALAQNNNHLVSEALGLYLAGCSFSNLPEAHTWREMGWRWLDWAFCHQIEEDGTYTQHSTNYHRLVLQAACLAIAAAQKEGLQLSQKAHQNLIAAARWLSEYVDPESGLAANLGSNDGANILPFSFEGGSQNKLGGFSSMLSPGFLDYRPTLQTAARALGVPAPFPPGRWDELSQWLGFTINQNKTQPGKASIRANPRLIQPRTWMSIRAPHFKSRPSHADILHVDFWWRGLPLALDAGTYRYTAVDPWNNSLARTIVHNTVSIDGKDQMVRAGKFLWLDWPKIGRELQPQKISAWHDGYHSLGIRHERSITCESHDQWCVEDRISWLGKARETPIVFLHWLLPDWPIEHYPDYIRIAHPMNGAAILRFSSCNQSTILSPINLIRCGEVIFGNREHLPSILGWYSPTYSVKLPALSVLVSVSGDLPLQFQSQWTLQDANR